MVSGVLSVRSVATFVWHFHTPKAAMIVCSSLANSFAVLWPWILFNMDFCHVHFHHGDWVFCLLITFKLHSIGITGTQLLVMVLGNFLISTHFNILRCLCLVNPVKTYDFHINASVTMSIDPLSTIFGLPGCFSGCSYSSSRSTGAATVHLNNSDNL